MDGLETHVDLSRPEVWAVASLALALTATNFAWLVARLTSRHARVSRLGRSSGVQALAWLVVALYLLLPPLGAWRYGAISPYLLGLAELDWINSIGAGGLLTALLIGLTVFGWLVYRHTATPAAETCAHEGRLVLALRAPIDAALAQWHLAFYRAALIAWLAAPEPLPKTLLQAMQDQSLYWGSWLGVGFLVVEAGLSPLTWRALAAPSSQQRTCGAPEAILRGLGMAVATTALFVITRNFWLCLLCQVAVETAIMGWLPLRVPASQRA